MSLNDTQAMDALTERANAFEWPTPPFAAYPRVQHTQGPVACEVHGVGGKHTRVQLLAFDLEREQVSVHVAGVGRPIALKFSQLWQLTLDEPIRPEPISSGDPHEALLAHRPEAPYLVKMTSGADVQGLTVGHVELRQGLFLFPPQDQTGVTSRVFIPRHAYQAFTVGARMGEILVEQAHVTSFQVLEAVQTQTELQQQRIGDVLVNHQIITPEQLLEAIDMQRNLPVMRLGEALMALDLITATELEDALRLQAEDKGIPLGELLVRNGVITREKSCAPHWPTKWVTRWSMC